MLRFDVTDSTCVPGPGCRPSTARPRSARAGSCAGPTTSRSVWCLRDRMGVGRRVPAGIGSYRGQGGGDGAAGRARAGAVGVRAAGDGGGRRSIGTSREQRPLDPSRHERRRLASRPAARSSTATARAGRPAAVRGPAHRRHPAAALARGRAGRWGAARLCRRPRRAGGLVVVLGTQVVLDEADAGGRRLPQRRAGTGNTRRRTTCCASRAQAKHHSGPVRARPSRSKPGISSFTVGDRRPVTTRSMVPATIRYADGRP